jgi:uncharacterized protein YcgL (UPF0745 family)
MKNIRLNNLLRNIILENSRLDVLIDKYTKPNKDAEKKTSKAIMGLDVLGQIIFADPTTKNPQGDFDTTNYSLENLKKVQPGQYANWLLRNFEKPQLDDTLDLSRARSLFMEDLFKVTEDLEKFTKYKQYFPVEQRDINKFTPDSLFKFLNNFELPERVKEKLKKTETKKEIRKERKGFEHPGGKIEFVGNDYTVVKIEGDTEKSREAACWYGGYYHHEKGESRWCTSPPNSNYFKTYIKKGPLYVILANNDEGKVGESTGLPQERYQFHFQENQFMDRFDQPIDLINFFNHKAPDLKEYFKPEFAHGLVTKGNKLDIVYPNSSAGKYIALYGFEELLQSMSDSLTEFSFINKSTDKLAFDVPASIGKFKQLTMLQLDGVVKSLPDEIGELSNLFMLVLSNNKQLKSLPASIGNLDNLVVLNLMGCNPKLFNSLPQEVQNKFDLDSHSDQFYVNKNN